jgi:hypothetical protein
MIVTAKFHSKIGHVVDNDYFRETKLLTKHKYHIKIEHTTAEVTDFLSKTARYDTTSHSSELCEDNTTTHRMCISATGMIMWCRAVFCPHDDEEITEVINRITKAVIELDPDIQNHLVSDCIYRNGICTREKPCGRSIEVLKQLISVVPERYYRDARNEKLLREIKGETVH